MTFSGNVGHGTNRRLHFGGASDYRMLLPGPSSPTSVLVLLQRYLCSSPQLLRRRFHVSGLQLRSPALMQTARLGVFVSNDLSERPPEQNGVMPRSLHMHEGSWLGFVSMKRFDWRESCCGGLVSTGLAGGFYHSSGTGTLSQQRGDKNIPSHSL